MAKATVRPGVAHPVVPATAAAIVGAVTVFYAPLGAMFIPGLAGVLVLAVLVRTLVPEGREQARVLEWVLLSFGLHLLVGLLVNNTDWLQHYLGPDARRYHETATDLARHWDGRAPAPILPGGKEGFYYVLAGLYSVFGAHAVAGLAVNATLSAALVPVLHDTTRRMFGPVAAARVPPLAVLIPGLIVWPAQLLKEAFVLFLLAAASNAAVRVNQRPSAGNVVALTVTLASLLTFRSHVGLIMAAGAVAGIALGHQHLLRGLTAGAATLSLAAVTVVVLGLGYTGYRRAVGSDLREADQVRRGLSSAREVRSGFGADADISTPAGALSHLPAGVVSFTLGPFPWQISGLRQLPVLPDVAVWWTLLPSLWRGQRVARQQVGRRFLVVVLPTVGVCLLLSLVVGNFGMAVRERAQLVILVLPVVALGLAERSARDSAEL